MGNDEAMITGDEQEEEKSVGEDKYGNKSNVMTMTMQQISSS